MTCLITIILYTNILLSANLALVPGLPDLSPYSFCFESITSLTRVPEFQFRIVVLLPPTQPILQGSYDLFPSLFSHWDFSRITGISFNLLPLPPTSSTAYSPLFSSLSSVTRLSLDEHALSFSTRKILVTIRNQQSRNQNLSSSPSSAPSKSAYLKNTALIQGQIPVVIVARTM